MHKKLLWVVVGLLLVPLTSSAIWQVADSMHGVKYHHGHAQRFLNVDYPQQYANGSAFLFKLRKCLLRDNVLRLAKKYGWQVVWRAPQNYYVTLNTEIVGSKFSITMNRLLSNYPLSAKYNAKRKRMIVSKC